MSIKASRSRQAKRASLLRADIVQRTDVRVIERGYRPGLAFETLQQLGVALDIVSEDFDRNGAFQPGVAGTVHFTHTPGTEQRENLVRAQPGSTGKGHSQNILPEVGLQRCPVRGGQLANAVTALQCRGRMVGLTGS